MKIQQSSLLSFAATATMALLCGSSVAAFSTLRMNMNNRSPLANQYKSITSIHNSILSGGGGIIRMAPPPGEPEPEVSNL